MNCVVTAGPTSEPLDAVRRLTNFSTGRLGSELAGFLSDRGHSVVLIKSTGSVYTDPVCTAETLSFSTTSELAECLQTLRHRQIDAVFHAAAVSDFAFGKLWTRQPDGELREIRAGKIPSDLQGGLLAELVPAPKLIRRLRDWFPAAWIAGWKYEVDGNRADALDRARQQISVNRTDACVLNGPAYGAGYGLLRSSGEWIEVPDRPGLCRLLADILAGANTIR